MNTKNNSHTFEMNVQSQMSHAPVVKIVLDDEGMEIHKIKFVTLWSKLKTERYSWNEVNRLVWRKYPGVNFLTPGNFGPYGGPYVLDIYTPSKISHMNIYQKRFMSNWDWNDLLNQIKKSSKKTLRKFNTLVS